MICIRNKRSVLMLLQLFVSMKIGGALPTEEEVRNICKKHGCTPSKFEVVSYRVSEDNNLVALKGRKKNNKVEQKSAPVVNVINNNSLTQMSETVSNQQVKQQERQMPESVTREAKQSFMFSGCFDQVKRNFVVLFGAISGVVASFSYIKAKYTVYCLMQACIQLEKWSAWKTLSMLKVLQSSGKLEATLIAALESQYSMHDDILNAFFIDLEQELQALNVLFKRCSEMSNNWVFRFFLPTENCVQDMQRKADILIYLKSAALEMLVEDIEHTFRNKYDDSNDGDDNGAESFLFDEG